MVVKFTLPQIRLQNMKLPDGASYCAIVASSNDCASCSVYVLGHSSSLTPCLS